MAFGFADEALIEVRSGKGGNGCVAFRREKYIPHGGPNGGDGGRGGDVYFVVKKNMRTLSSLRHRQCFKAKNGGDGQGWNRHGKDGDDVFISVPPGTTIRDAETDELIHDFTTEGENEPFKFLEGGKGGWGNVHFKSSTNQAPRQAHPGTPGETRFLRVELSIMADAGLVGFPSAGKSSLLAAFTNARPKVAPYPFTTKIPNLGVLRVDDESDVIIADIPGIIEGASEGLGLGDQFLKHITRTSCLIFMIDASDTFEGTNCFTAYETLKNELKNYSEDLLQKPRIVFCNKIDVEGAYENAVKIIEEIRKNEPETICVPISVMNNRGMKDARQAILRMVNVDDSGSENVEVKSKKSNVKDKKENVKSGEGESDFMKGRDAYLDDDDEMIQYPGSENSSGEID